MEDEISYGTTTNYELPYPNDYTDMADVPEVVKQLAEKIDTEMFGVVGDQDEKIAKAELILSQLPKVTGEGTNISLSPTIEYDLEVGSYKGDTTQNTLTGKNLFNPVIKIGSVDIIQHLATVTTDLETNEMTFTSTTDGEIWLGNVVSTGTAYNYTTGWIMEVEPDTSYTFQSINNVINRVVWTEFDENKISLGFRDVGATITTKSNTKYLLARIGKQQTTSGTTYKDKIQIRKTSTLSDFELYCGGIPSPNPNYPQNIQVVTGTQTVTISNADNTESQTYTLHLGDLELAKIGAAQDYIYYNNGKWYKYGAIRKVKASELTQDNIALASQGTFLTNINAIASPKCACYCNGLTYKGSVDEAWNLKNGNYIGQLYDGFRNIYINKDYTIKTELLNWLLSFNFTLYYVLETPTTTEITNSTLLSDLEYIRTHAMSYSGTTNISSSGDLSIVISASAIKQLS